MQNLCWDTATNLNPIREDDYLNVEKLQCLSCNTNFGVDKPPSPHQGYKCPACGLSAQLKVDKGGLAVLNDVLAATKPQIMLTQLSKLGSMMHQQRIKTTSSCDPGRQYYSDVVIISN